MNILYNTGGNKYRFKRVKVDGAVAPPLIERPGLIC